MEITTIALGGVNCYLMEDKGNFGLVDCGGPMVNDKTWTDRYEQLQSALEKAGCRLGNLKILVITHGDWDHMFNGAALRQRYNSKIALQQEDLDRVAKPTIPIWLSSVHFRSPLMQVATKLASPLIKKSAQNVLSNFQAFVPDIIFDQVLSLEEFGLDAQVLHFPGHTAGSSLVITGDGDLICGDTLNSAGKKIIAAPNAEDFKKLEISIARLGNLKPKMVYPGHGKPFAWQAFRS